MNKIDLISMSFKNLFKRKVRTFLTILSVVIGATSIIVMVSLGVALDEKFKSEIQNLDSMTVIEINAYNNKVSKADLKNIKSLPSIIAITPILQANLRLILDGKYVGSFDIYGIEPYAMEFFGYKAKDGRILNEEDEGKLNMVFGDKTIYAFDKKGKSERWYKYVDSPEDIKKAYKADVLNGSLKITTNENFGVKKQSAQNVSVNKVKTYKANAVGILEESDRYDIKHRVFMPFSSLEKIVKEIDVINGVKRNPKENNKNGYERVLVKVDSFQNVEKTLEDIKTIFKDAKKDVSIYSEAEFVKSSKKLTTMVQALLGGIGGISLFIAAIGITNTMIMSIYERTKEIGILKVIGAKVSDIKRLFLLEASLIGFIGGFIGVLFSYLISFGLNKFSIMFLGSMGMEDMSAPSKISSIPLWLALGSLVFSSLIGLLAGYLPAKKVVKIEALKAIKSE